ncbi:hypothetical protein Tco_1341463 [Tanacetum coccineum]
MCCTLEAVQRSVVANDVSSQVPSNASENVQTGEKFKLRLRMKLSERDDDDSQDNNYIVDEDNNMDEVHVDMNDFNYNSDKTVEFMRYRDKVEPVANEE